MKHIISVVCLSLLVSACSSSSTGRQQITLFSNDQLNQMGSESFEEMKQKEKINTDNALNSYVQCVADAIIAVSPTSTHQGAWEVVVFESEQINAFALPGGKIGVYTGILNVANTPDQLAAIMGHEVSHVLERHSNERLSSGQLVQAGMVAAEVVLAASDVENKGLWMAGLGLGVQFGLVMPYSRIHESEADIVGQDLMAKAGFEPSAAITLWENMGKASKGAPPEFMSTHPANETRIKQLSDNLPNATRFYLASKKSQCKKP